MRLLLLIRDPYPNNRPDILTLFGERLPARGVWSDIVAVRRGHDEAASSEWPAGEFLGFDGRIGSILDTVRAALQDLAILRRARNYDAVVVRDKIFAAAAALLIAPRGRVHYWMSFPFPEEDLARARAGGSGSLLRRALLAIRGYIGGWLLYGWVVPRARVVFVQSERMRERVAERCGRNDGVVPVPMGIDESTLPPDDRGAARLEPGMRVQLGYLGTLDRTRRLDFLLDVLFRLGERENYRFELLLIGDASNREEREWLVSRIAELGLSDLVEITGALPRASAWQRLSKCHVALSAIPRGELFDVSSPTKTVEYLVLGLPVVVNDIPDQKWLIKKTGAGICVPMDVESFADGIETVCSEHEAFRSRARACRSWLVSERGYDRLANLVVSHLRSSESQAS
jgi:glycosyltransferase involved in cell wall biosynthesis